MAAEDEMNYFRNLHNFEQASANLRPITSMLSSYMESLLQNGFTRPEALRLVIRLQDRIFEMAWRDRGAPDQE
jgi:hypothetical protein